MERFEAMPEVRNGPAVHPEQPAIPSAELSLRELVHVKRPDIRFDKDLAVASSIGVQTLANILNGRERVSRHHPSQISYALRLSIILECPRELVLQASEESCRRWREAG